MKFKKAMAFALSLAMLGSTSAFTAFAEDAPKQTYDYVALGDSIAAGFGLAGAANLATDPALILTKDLIANPVQDAYPAVFGTYIAEAGAKYGYDVTATNLSTTAYRAEDIENVILNPDTKGEMATFIFETFVGEGASDILLPYHDIFEEYLPEAELVSIQLGGNDLMMATLSPMFESENPIISSMALGLMLQLFGCDMETCVGAAMLKLEAAKDSISYQTITEAFQYLGGLNDTEDMLQNSADNVKKVVEAVRTKNPDADIALINMFNPYIMDYDYAAAFCQIIRETFKKAIEDNTDCEIDVEPEVTPEVCDTDEEAEEVCQNNHRAIRRLKVLVNAYKERKQAFTERKKAEMAELLENLTNEIAYPYMYTMKGKSSDVQLQSLNEKLYQVSEETGTMYVDVYGYVTPELDADPHPKAEGHKQIADRLWETIGEHVDSSIADMRTAPTFEKQNLTLGGEIAVNFYLNLDNLTEEERNNCYVEFTVGGKTSTDTFNPNDMNQSKQYYGFTCKVPSVGMADEITAVLHYGNNKTVTKTYTVEQYLNLFDERDPAVLLNLIHAINDYGYYSQQYLSKNAETPWTIGVDHTAMAKAFKTSYSTSEINTIKGKIADKQIVRNLNSDIQKVNYALNLDSDTTIGIYIKPAEGYTGDVAVTLDGNEVSAKLQADGRYLVNIPKLAPQNFDDMHQVVITTENGTSTVDVSVLSYVYDCLSDPLNAEETNAMAAIYYYYATTEAYIA